MTFKYILFLASTAFNSLQQHKLIYDVLMELKLNSDFRN